MFSSKATVQSGDTCKNSSGVAVTVVNQEVNGSTTTKPSGSGSGAASPTTTPSAGISVRSNLMSSVTVAIGLGVVFLTSLI